MFCKNCGKEIKDGAAFCSSCGAKTEKSTVTNVDTTTAAAETKKKHPTKIVIGAIIAAIVIIIIAIVASNGGDSHTEKNNTKKSDDTDVEQQIYDVLNSTPAVDGYYTSVGTALNAVFSDYSVSFKQWGGETSYNVTISGTYCPNPEVPQYTNSGTITYVVDIESGYCQAREDDIYGYGIDDVIKVYVVNYLG